jgi:hypothetical protein
MASFELLNRAAVEKFSLGPLELKDSTTVGIFLPVVVAYLEYQLVRQMLHWRSLERIFAAAIAVVQPRVTENQLGSYLMPPVPLLYNRYPKGAPFENVFSFQQRIERLFAVMCAFLLPAFQVYALTEVFRRLHGQSRTMFVIAACMTTVLTIAYLIAIFTIVTNVVHWRFYKTFLDKDSSVRLRLGGRRVTLTRSRRLSQPNQSSSSSPARDNPSATTPGPGDPRSL